MNTATILVVDDEPQLRRAMRATLTDLGYSVIEARTGEEALEVLRRDPTDLVLLDLNMPGIGPDEIERVFEKFYRGRRGRAKVEGTGMGLSIAKGIVEAHGGKIHAENRAGGGAVIFFTLPMQPITS